MSSDSPAGVTMSVDWPPSTSMNQNSRFFAADALSERRTRPRTARTKRCKLGVMQTTLTRRSVLKRAGLAIVAAASPRGLFAAETVSPVMARLSEYMSAAAGRQLPEEVVEKAKHHILDTFAAMISGADLPPARAAFQFARDFAGEKVA